jgi:hypothetical protein
MVLNGYTRERLAIEVPHRYDGGSTTAALGPKHFVGHSSTQLLVAAEDLDLAPQRVA